MLIKNFFLHLFIFHLTYSYKSYPTQYICIETINGISQTLPSCLPGYIIDIENVIYESTNDDTCSGTSLCQIKNKNTFLFACNRKRTCQIDINTLRFHINSTCGSTKRFFVYYRCLPIIYEQKDFLCESSTLRRPSLGDINLSCTRNYRLYITNASIGISLKSQDDTKTRFKCNKDTQTICNTLVSNNYRDICQIQSKQECKITYNQRPMLRDCQYGMISNFSSVEYSCIPDNTMEEDLPRIDICSKENNDRISNNRGLLQSSNYPQDLGEYLFCKKELFIPRESRIRLFILEKSLDDSHELNIYIMNDIRRLNQNDMLDLNLTNEEIIKIELKTNHLSGGKFLIYYQIDSRFPEYAPYVLEPDKKTKKFAFNQNWGILIGCFIGLLLLLLAIIIAIILITKRRRIRSVRYLKNDDDDHHQQLNLPITSHDNEKNLQIEPTYLASSSPTILPSVNNHDRPHSASSTTSSIIMHQIHDGKSDRESLIKPLNQQVLHTNKDIDNLYEEIKEQQQQTALALGIKGQSSVPPIRDHHETEPRYQQPKSFNKPQPSAPSFDLIENKD